VASGDADFFVELAAPGLRAYEVELAAHPT
jgi:hypothetical protein